MPQYRSTLPLKKINAELDYLWHQFQIDATMRQEAIDLGLDVSGIVHLPRVEALPTAAGAAHLDPVTTALIVSFSPLAAKILTDVWNQIIKPRFIDRNGKASLEDVAES